MISTNININHNMNSKIITSNLLLLNKLNNKIVNEANKIKIKNFIDLYESRKITNFLTVKNIIKGFTEADTDKKLKAINKKYDIVNSKYVFQQPLKTRLSKNSHLKNVELRDMGKAKSEIVFHIKPQLNEDGDIHENGLKLYDVIHKTIFKRMCSEVVKVIIRKKNVKVQTTVMYKTYKLPSEDDVEMDENGLLVYAGDKSKLFMGKYILSKPLFVHSKAEFTNENNIKEVLNREQVFNDNKLKENSSSVQLQIFEIIISIYEIKKARVGSYIPTPTPYNNANCGLVNIRNDDDMCFKYCTKYHLTDKTKHCDRVTVLNKIDDVYNYSDINYPVSYDDIKTFENNNKISVRVYDIDPDGGLLINMLENIEYIKNGIIYLLLIEEGDKSHYIYIKHIQKILNLSYVRGCDNVFCPYCNKNIGVEEYNKRHVNECYKRVTEDGALLKLPKEGSVMKFLNHRKKQKRPYIIYCDMESTLVKNYERVEDDKNTYKTHRHEVNSCCYYLVCSFDSTQNILKTFEGDNCVIDMIEEIYNLTIKKLNKIDSCKYNKCSHDDEKKYNDSLICGVCDLPFSEECKKSKSYDLMTGKYKEAVHFKCNVNYYINKYVPVVFHNLRGYDSHFIIKEAYTLSNKLNNARFNVIPLSYEKFMSFDINHLRFIDSYLFMAESLEKLIENLYDKEDKYKNFPNMKKYYNDDELKLLCRKGFYPYDWMDNNDKLNHYQGLPTKDEFYNKLCQSSISDTDYEHALNVYKKLDCKNFKDYHMTYLKCDVLLLADVYENFRIECEINYNLDSANYISLASLCWDAMLLLTKIELDLISDPLILEMIEKSKRGGLVFSGSKRSVEANNPLLKNYDKEKETGYLMYWDANALYAHAMSQSLPYQDLKFSDVGLDEILKTPDDSEIGYIVEVDLSCEMETKEETEKLHDYLKEYPPAPESMCIKSDMLSKYQKDLNDKYKVKYGDKNKKLVPHLMDKKNYVIHYRNLKYLHGLGIKISVPHRVISFKQKEWLKVYIDFNTEKRSHAKNKFQQDFYKLASNSVYGKSFENVRKRVNIHMVTEEPKAIKLFSKNNFKTAKHFNSLYLIELYKNEIVYDKPIYVGTSILDLSKLHMMKFHYEVISVHFGGCYILIYSDTDSLVYYIKTEDIYKWARENSTHFDFSEDKLKPDEANKKVTGKFKDEMKGLVMAMFTNLNAKVYCYEVEGEESRKGKGIPKTTLKNEIKNSDYLHVLNTGACIEKEVTSIRSYDHSVYTIKSKKRCLTPLTDKSYAVDNNNFLPFGHYAMNKHKLKP